MKLQHFDSIILISFVLFLAPRFIKSWLEAIEGGVVRRGPLLKQELLLGKDLGMLFGCESCSCCKYSQMLYGLKLKKILFSAFGSSVRP